MQIYKYIITIFLSLVVTSPAYAQSFHIATNSGRPVVTHEMLRPTIATQDLAHWKTKADVEIDRRVTALQALITKLQGSTKLSVTQKATYTTQLQTTVTSLTALKSKIDADTDLVTLKSDVQSVVNSYRIFGLYLPKNSLLIAANNMLATTDKLASVEASLQMKIQSAQTAGQDVGTLKTVLTDMQTKLTDAKTQAQSIITAVTPLSPTSLPTNTVVLKNARLMLAAGIQDIKTAGADAKTVYKGLKMNKIKNPSTPSAQPTL